jgi:branched-chain amino acid aminotransferase
VREARLPREMLLLADELFFTGTAAELTPIRSVDRQPVGDGRPGEITRAIQDRYLGIARGRYPDAHGWRTPVPLAAPVPAGETREPQPVG